MLGRSYGTPPPPGGVPGPPPGGVPRPPPGGTRTPPGGYPDCNQCSFRCVLHCRYPHLHRSTAICQVYITTCLLIRFQLLIAIDNICRSLFILQIFLIISDFSRHRRKPGKRCEGQCRTEGRKHEIN